MMILDQINVRLAKASKLSPIKLLIVMTIRAVVLLVVICLQSVAQMKKSFSLFGHTLVHNGGLVAWVQSVWIIQLYWILRKEWVVRLMKFSSEGLELLRSMNLRGLKSNV